MQIRELISTLFARYRHLILYGIIGCCTATLDFLVFTGLTSWTPVHYILANVISCSTGILCSFLLCILVLIPFLPQKLSLLSFRNR